MFDETPQNKGITSSLKLVWGQNQSWGAGDGDLKEKEGPQVLSTTSDIIAGFIGMTERRMNLHGKSHNKWVISEASVIVKGSYNTKVPSESDLVMGKRKEIYAVKIKWSIRK
ncbi:hypothetical protein Tco_0410771 [Tanacetum coccineum]